MSDDETQSDDDAVADEAISGAEQSEPTGGSRAGRLAAFVVLPVLLMVLGAGVGVVKYQESKQVATERAKVESVQAATDGVIALLSYRPDSVQQQLEAASARLTGGFKDEYLKLIRDVVIPGSLQKQISAVATVPSAAVVSATPDTAVVLVFVNQSIVMGQEPPSSTTSAVRVGLAKNQNSWQITKFDPI